MKNLKFTALSIGLGLAALLGACDSPPGGQPEPGEPGGTLSQPEEMSEPSEPGVTTQPPESSPQPTDPGTTPQPENPQEEDPS